MPQPTPHRQPNARRDDAKALRALYDYWSERFVEWAEGPERIQLHDGNTTTVRKLQAAVFSLLRNMDRDGYLRYRDSGDDFSLEACAGFMHVGKRTAVLYLEWMRRTGCMTAVPAHDEMGHHLSSVRRLVVPDVVPAKPKPKVPVASSDRNSGTENPKFPNGGAKVPVSSSQVADTQVPRRRVTKKTPKHGVGDRAPGLGSSKKISGRDRHNDEDGLSDEELIDRELAEDARRKERERRSLLARAKLHELAERPVKGLSLP